MSLNLHSLVDCGFDLRFRDLDFDLVSSHDWNEKSWEKIWVNILWFWKEYLIRKMLYTL